MTQPVPHSPTIARPRAARDPRLDVFRGLGMFIILIAHIPGNDWADWIPARFGFSDATEIFVFCSGIASCYAFGAIFDRHGWLWGARRIAFRVWQVYWGHVAVFVVVVATLGLADHLIAGAQYIRHDLNLAHFVDDPAYLFFRFLTLGYVPNYFDILPMYLVILALVPVVMAIAGYSRAAVGVFSLGLWGVAALGWLELPAEPWSGRAWFFNPFSWQLVFFTGFAFGRGWLPAPPRDTRLMLLACAVLLASAPFSCHYGFGCYAGWGYVPWLGSAHDALFPLIDKSHLGAFRYLHFLALAYVAFVLAGVGGHALKGRAVEALMRVGRQTLAVFLSGLVLAQLLGVAIDLMPGPATQFLVNVGGCGLLMLVAAIVTAFKANPGPGGGRRVHSTQDGHDGPPLRAPAAGSSNEFLPG